MKIVTIVGARPQFIKAGPVSRALGEASAFEEVLVHTGQHYDYAMSDLFFRQLKLPAPDYNLGIGSGSHGVQTGKMLAAVEQVLLDECPACVLVYGDTNSTLAGALAAVKLTIPVGHIEAGLRSFDRSMPEEINRVVTDHLSALLFVPTRAGVENLADEGITHGVHLVGDVMYDALIFNRAIAKESTILDELGLEQEKYCVATVHRASNTDDQGNLASILEAFVASDEEVVFPVHPRTRKAMVRHGLFEFGEGADNLRLIEPVGYLDFLQLLANARMVLTDSGGIQKEAYLLGVPCITLRDTTEWVETLEAGWNILVGADRAQIQDALSNLAPEQERVAYYGDGDAGKKVCKVLSEYLAD